MIHRSGFAMTTVQFPIEERAPDAIADLAMGMRLSMAQGREIQPDELFAHLNKANLKAVLIGGHAVNARTGRPRATVDIDILAEKPKKVVDLILQAYPHLKVEDHPVVSRFKDADHEAIDVIKPTSSLLFKRILKLTESIKVGGVEIAIPGIEAMLALKHASLISPWRKVEDKYTDGRDFILIVKGAPKLDESLLKELGELTCPSGGDDLLHLVADARAGKTLRI
jgi:hypothetical protein